MPLRVKVKLVLPPAEIIALDGLTEKSVPLLRVTEVIFRSALP